MVEQSSPKTVYELELAARGYPQPGEYWRPITSHRPLPAPTQVEQVGATTIWLAHPSGQRYTMKLLEFRDTWIRAENTNTHANASTTRN